MKVIIRINKYQDPQKIAIAAQQKVTQITGTSANVSVNQGMFSGLR